VEVAEIMALVLYFLGAVALVLLIILLWRALQVLTTVDKITEDVYQKSQKLDGIFNLIDKLELLNDRVVNAIIKGVMKFFDRKKKGDEIDE